MLNFNGYISNFRIWGVAKTQVFNVNIIYSYQNGSVMFDLQDELVRVIGKTVDPKESGLVLSFTLESNEYYFNGEAVTAKFLPMCMSTFL